MYFSGRDRRPCPKGRRAGTQGFACLAQLEKKWSPDPVPVFSAEESLAKFKVAPGFKVELVASEPVVKDPSSWIGTIREGCGSGNFAPT